MSDTRPREEPEEVQLLPLPRSYRKITSHESWGLGVVETDVLPAEFRGHAYESVQWRLMLDVPVALFGGIRDADSRILTLPLDESLSFLFAISRKDRFAIKISVLDPLDDTPMSIEGWVSITGMSNLRLKHPRLYAIHAELFSQCLFESSQEAVDRKIGCLERINFLLHDFRVEASGYPTNYPEHEGKWPAVRYEISGGMILLTYWWETPEGFGERIEELESGKEQGE